MRARARVSVSAVEWGRARASEKNEREPRRSRHAQTQTVTQIIHRKWSGEGKIAIAVCTTLNLIVKPHESISASWRLETKLKIKIGCWNRYGKLVKKFLSLFFCLSFYLCVWRVCVRAYVYSVRLLWSFFVSPFCFRQLAVASSVFLSFVFVMPYNFSQTLWIKCVRISPDN